MVLVRGHRPSGQMNSVVTFSRHEGLLTAAGVRKEKPAVLAEGGMGGGGIQRQLPCLPAPSEKVGT